MGNNLKYSALKKGLITFYKCEQKEFKRILRIK